MGVNPCPLSTDGMNNSFRTPDVNPTNSTAADPLMQVNDLVTKVATSCRDKVKRRSDMRYPLTGRLKLGALDKSGGFRATIDAAGVDISYQGVGLITTKALLNGRRMMLDLSSMTGLPCVLPVTVVHCEEMLAGVYRCGVIFELDQT